MKIIDCFIFYNELDMLKFRLEYLYDTVDHFVLVEMYKTHSGNLKPYYFNENKKLFEKYLDKIVHVMVDDDYVPLIEYKNKLKFGLKKKEYTPTPNIQREVHHRNCIRRGIDKLDDANKAGTSESMKCTLILTEGDSAKALAIAGLTVVGRDYFGVFPLKGKNIKRS